MPPFKNFFSRTGANEINDESNTARPAAHSNPSSAAISVKSREEPAEYKMSVVNDSGVYLPPSPPEKKSFWHRAPSSQSNHRSVLAENEPFSISRESFDSYRRSFDISARSPVIQPETMPRASLDSRHSRLAPRASLNINRSSFDRPMQEEDEGFEDVGLNDEPKPTKKKGFFSRFGESNANADGGSGSDASRPASSHHGVKILGRKRGQSGQGAELGDMSQTKTLEAKEEELKDVQEIAK